MLMQKGGVKTSRGAESQPKEGEVRVRGPEPERGKTRVEAYRS